MQLDTYTPRGNLRGFIMPDFIFTNPKLCLGSKMLYAVLCTYAGERDHCWPSHTTLSKKLDCSVSSIKIYLKKLIKEKLIAPMDVSKNKIRSCLYYMLRPTTTSASNKAVQHRPSQNLTTPQSDSGYKYNFKEINTYTPLPPKSTSLKTSSAIFPIRKAGGGNFSVVNKTFEEFYSYYPKKEGKELARSIWFKLYKQGHIPSHEELIAAIAAMKNSHQWQKDNGRYIPMPSNFLRFRRFEDVLFTIREEQKIKIENQKKQAIIDIKEQEKQVQSQEKLAKIRPCFEAIARKFAVELNTAPAFGLFSFLHEKGIAPKESDIPQSAYNTKILPWLNDYKNAHCA